MTTPARWHGHLLCILLATGLLLAGCSTIDRGHDAALLLADLQAGAEDSALKRRTDPPSVESLTYTINGHTQVADRYQGTESPRGTLLLIHGLTDQGRRDPRLVNFAQSLARSGFRVLAPELPGLTEMNVGRTERDDIVTALRFANREQNGDALGLVALSLAAGPAILAAMDPQTADDIDYLLLVGPYYDIVDLIRYATTGVDEGSGRQDAVPQPMREGQWMLLLSQLHHLDHPNDRDRLQAIAERRLQNEQAPVERLVDGLSDEGRAVFDLINNTDPQRVEPLTTALPASVQEQLAMLDLSRHNLDPLQARLLLVHGAHDPVIPVSHSERLSRELPPDQVELFIPPDLDHVDIEPGLRDSWRLWQATRRLLTLAEESR